MKFAEVEKAAKLAGHRVPVQWREDVQQEVVCRCLELEAEGVKLTAENVSAVAMKVVDYAFRHWVHNQHGREALRPVSLDTIVEDGEGNRITLADAIPSPACFANVVEWVEARIALQSMPPKIAKLAAMALLDKAHLPKSAREQLRAWAKQELVLA